MNGEVSVVALVRGEEQYIFMFNEANRTETLRMLGRYAADPNLSFTWYDAAVLSQRIRELMPAASIASVQKKGNNSASSHTFSLPTPKSPKGKPDQDPAPSISQSPAPRFRLQSDL